MNKNNIVLIFPATATFLWADSNLNIILNEIHHWDFHEYFSLSTESGPDLRDKFQMFLEFWERIRSGRNNSLRAVFVSQNSHVQHKSVPVPGWQSTPRSFSPTRIFASYKLCKGK